MKTRILTGLVIGVLLISLCLFSGTIALPIVVTVLTLIGTGEMLKCVGTLKKLPVAMLSFAFAAAADALLFLTDTFSAFSFCIMMMISVYLLGLLAIVTFSKGKITTDDAFSSFTGVFYTVLGFACLVLIRREGNGYLLAMTIWLPLISDIFAYFTGYFIGKHKLIPEVSPKKTVEGALGGMFFCGIGCIVFAVVLSVMNDTKLSVMLFVRMFAVGLICSIVAQIGDLIMSVIKRRYDVKDYGKLFPGHGGVLDRFDSVIAVAIVVLLLTFIPGFVSFAA
jgi:phosphatidate cytidylyltransferase